MIASGSTDLSRLAPVIVVVAVFVSVWQVLKRSRRKQARLTGAFVEVWVGDDRREARWIATGLREHGFTAVANVEPQAGDEATLWRQRPGDGRAFVAVRKSEVEDAQQWLAGWQSEDDAGDDERDGDDDDGELRPLEVAPGDELDAGRSERSDTAHRRAMRLALFVIGCALVWQVVESLLS